MSLKIHPSSYEPLIISGAIFVLFGIVPFCLIGSATGDYTSAMFYSAPAVVPVAEALFRRK